MNLPHGDRAVIDQSKILDFLLSGEPPVGKFKAAFFESLGHTPENWERLRDDPPRLTRVADAAIIQASEFGQNYEIRAALEGPSGHSAGIVMIWIVLHGEDIPRFITAYPGG